MKPTLLLLAILLLGFVLWLGRPYQLTSNPECTQNLIDEKSKLGEIPNCGNSSFLSRIDEHWIEFSIHGRPVIANVTLEHMKNCSGQDFDMHGDHFIFYGDTLSHSNGPVCLDIIAGGGNW